jgi:hypothetical protein
MKRRTFVGGAAIAGSAAALGEALGLLSPQLRAATPASPLDRLDRAGITAAARLTRYGGSHPTESVDVPLKVRALARRDLGEASWSCALRAVAVRGAVAKAGRPEPAPPDAVDLWATFKLQKGHSPEASVGLALSFARWSRDNFVLMPGACYAGNRFESRHITYPPLLSEPADIGPNVPIIVSDIPRLNVRPGPSRLQLLAADLATPAVGLHVPGTRTGILILADPTTRAGLSGLTVEESDDRTRATVILSAPGVREDVAYATGSTRVRSKDRAAAFRAGDELTLRVRVYLFECPEVQGLFDRFAAVRKELSGPTARPHELPFSEAFKVHEERINRRWVEDEGYFAVGGRQGDPATWQSGWCGGLATTLPLLGFGAARSRERALRNLAFAFEGGQAPSGFFHSIHDGKTWQEDGPAATRGPVPETARRAPGSRRARKWHLVRRSADALTFTCKQLMVLRRQDKTFKPDSHLVKGVGRCADAFVRLWDRYKQLGQYVDVETGELIVGGSTSAGLAPAGLALAAAYLKRDDYLAVAKAAAEHMYERYVRIGVTCGGPGDALQCPDSQSAAALLESFVTLFEQTGETIWTDRATAVARQLATWVISYDFWPAGGGAETAGAMRSAGAVFGNAQDRRGAPGYVALSGDALFRLYRATGDRSCLELLRDTVHNLAQYLPRGETSERAARAATEGALGRARADTGDWAEPAEDMVPADGVFDTIGLLTCTEVPGVYVRTSTGFLFAFDHVDARVTQQALGRLIVTLTNPTQVEATVRVLGESDGEAARPLEPGALLAARLVVVPAGGSADVEFEAPAELSR